VDRAVKATEARELDVAELEQRLAETRRELFNLRFQHATGQLENTGQLKEVRKNIARLLTVLTQKRQENEE
jgi:large subunit ribosomal protein L29